MVIMLNSITLAPTQATYTHRVTGVTFIRPDFCVSLEYDYHVASLPLTGTHYNVYLRYYHVKNGSWSLYKSTTIHSFSNIDENLRRVGESGGIYYDGKFLYLSYQKMTLPDNTYDWYEIRSANGTLIYDTNEGFLSGITGDGKQLVAVSGGSNIYFMEPSYNIMRIIDSTAITGLGSVGLSAIKGVSFDGVNFWLSFTKTDGYSYIGIFRPRDLWLDAILVIEDDTIYDLDIKSAKLGCLSYQQSLTKFTL